MKKINSFLVVLLLMLASLAANAQNSPRGDVNGDSEVNIADVNATIDVILSGGSNTAADVNNDGEINIADINVLIDIILGGGAPAPDEHEYVDLGLPSGTLWATCNIGANSPEEFGDYFAWGETEPKDYYGWGNYKWFNFIDDQYFELTKYDTDIDDGDGKTELDPEDDAAYVNWGPSWSMPTKEQFRELITKCGYGKRATLNGVNGRLFTGPNGNTLFLPAAGIHYGDDLEYAGSDGYYWSNTLDTSDDLGPVFASTLEFHSYMFYTETYSEIRIWGLTVRPVRVPASEQGLYIKQDSLELGSVPIGETRTDELTIVNKTNETVTVTITVEEPFLLKQDEGTASSMTVVVPRKTNAPVTVMFTANTQGDFNANITFQNPAFDGGKSVIPVHAAAIDYDYVDLGLPSGTLWATMNVGAETPEGYGDYFLWGETAPRLRYDWDSYMWCNGSWDALTKYNNMGSYGKVDNKTELDPEDDAARVNWGPLWRMPTSEQLLELMEKCTWEWTVMNGVNGQLATGPNGNTMFLPAAGLRSGTSRYEVGESGYYWSRTLDTTEPSGACILYFDSVFMDSGSGSRGSGQVVRAVRVPRD